MIKVLEFVTLYKNMCGNGTKTIKYYNKIYPILKLLVELNGITFFKIFTKNNKKFVFLKINKKLNITINKNIQNITFTKRELIKITKIDKSFLIISNNEGLKIINPYSKITVGGMLIAKIIL
jgi:hypothetical protein